MMQKYLLAFVLGGVVAGGVVYFAVSRRAEPAPPPAPVKIQTSQPAPAQPPVAEPEAPQPAAEPASVSPQPVRTTRRPQAVPSRPVAAGGAPPAAAPSQPAVVAQAQEPTVVLPPPTPAPPPQLPPPPPAENEAKPVPKHSNILRPDPADENAPHTPQTVTLPAGTLLTVRLRQPISTDKQSDGDPFTATLDQPVVIDGFVIADRGSPVQGKIASLTRASRGKSHASVALELTEINTTDGQRVDVRTDQSQHEATSHTKKDLAKVGAVAALGAIIGAAAGGGAGAAIGAGAGAAGGGGVVMASKGEEVRLPSETRLSFKLAEAVTLTEKLK